jgi:hypothetical protein
VKKIAIFALLVVVALAVLEVCLRIFFGLGSPPLVYASPKFGYAFVPNQSLKRFGHPISYNEQGLRSPAIRPLTGSSYRVLCVGGSVTNGGALMDQKDTYPYQLEAILKSKGQDVQVLNASGVGWDFLNEYGFLQDKGLFDAKVLVVEVGTRQLFQLSTETSIVGLDPNLPDRNPSTAIGEVLERYVMPRVRRRLGSSSPQIQVGWTSDALTDENYHRGLETLTQIVALASRSGVKPILLLIPDRDEASPGRYRRDYQSDLSNLAASAKGQLVDILPAWHTEVSQGHDLLRDLVDPNVNGNRLMAEAVAAAILPQK